MGILEATVDKPLFQLINHIYMGQDTRDTANNCLIYAVYMVNPIFAHLFLHLFLIFGVDLSISS